MSYRWGVILLVSCQAYILSRALSNNAVHATFISKPYTLSQSTYAVINNVHFYNAFHSRVS